MSWDIRDSVRALRHRNFRLFVPGQFVSLIGFWMQNVGMSWLVYRMTRSAGYLGAINFTQQIPILLLATTAGGFVDRTNRHRLVKLSQCLLLLQSAVLAWLTYSGRINIPLLFVMAGLLGIISAIDLPARQAFLVQMVNREDLMNAIALNSSMFNAARMIGPAIAGFAVARWGEAFCFLMNACSYLAVLAPLALMRINSTEPLRKQSFGQDLREGIAFVRDTRPVRVLLLLLGAFGVAGFSFLVLLPVYADQVFQRGATGLGWLMAATGVGALMGAFFLAGRKGLRGLGRLISTAAYIFPSALVLFSFSTNFALSFLLLCVVGFFMMVLVASINTSIQSIIPDDLRGRVMSFFTTMLIGTAPVGSFIAGAAADRIGVEWTVLISAVICFCASVWFSRSLPSIAGETRRLYNLHNAPPPGEAIPQ